jgi:hypothetical protein
MATYVCPMHADIRESGAGKCPVCGMSLVAEGTRFALLKHMASNPLHLAIMVAAMLALMAAAMMLLH